MLRRVNAVTKFVWFEKENQTKPNELFGLFETKEK